MVRKKNSFVITEIKDYQKKTGDKNVQNVVKTLKTDQVKVKTFLKSSDYVKNYESNENITTNGKTNEERSVTTDETRNGSYSVPKPFKTNNFLRKCFENRRQNGMILLSPKIEQKIYKLKKSLRKKGLEESEIINIIRQRRREEEIKYNKEASRNCFKCRQSGHFFADCPYNNNDNDGGDVCYRCGSSEHKLSECRQRAEGLPFAKCFICQEVGHLTRDCTQNTRGVYPKGGECKACHSVNHLIKDCPQNQKEQEMETEMTLPIIEDDHSLDAEVMDNSVAVKIEDKSQKIIKF